MPKFTLLRKKLQDREQPVAEEQETPSAQSATLPAQENPGLPSEATRNPAEWEEPPQEIPEEGTPLERAEKEDLAELAPEAPAEQDDSLLGIFKSEEAKNLELGSLTDGLEDIDVNELLQDCRHLATQLRRGPPP